MFTGILEWIGPIGESAYWSEPGSFVFFDDFSSFKKTWDFLSLEDFC